MTVDSPRGWDDRSVASGEPGRPRRTVTSTGLENLGPGVNTDHERRRRGRTELTRGRERRSSPETKATEPSDVVPVQTLPGSHVHRGSKATSRRREEGRYARLGPPGVTSSSRTSDRGRQRGRGGTP